MNVLKNMEAIFLVAVALATVSTYASARVPELRAAHTAQVAVQGGKMAVVKVEGKRIHARHATA